jgi:hypothetical protein
MYYKTNMYTLNDSVYYDITVNTKYINYSVYYKNTG